MDIMTSTQAIDLLRKLTRGNNDATRALDLVEIMATRLCPFDCEQCEEYE